MQTIVLDSVLKYRFCRKVGFQKRFTLVVIAAIELNDPPPIHSDEFRPPNFQKDLPLSLNSLPSMSSLWKMDVVGQIALFRIIMVKVI